ncbi:MAG: outer membrane beta-barrel protein [Chitinophagaceae bacterium]
MKYNLDDDDDYNGRVSFGLTYNYRNHFLNYGAELNVDNRGAQKTYTDGSNGLITDKLNFSYISLPLKFGFIVGKKLSAIANIGIVPGYLLSASEKMKIRATKESYRQVPDHYGFEI